MDEHIPFKRTVLRADQSYEGEVYFLFPDEKEALEAQVAGLREDYKQASGEIDRLLRFNKYKRFTHEDRTIDYNAMNLVDDFAEAGHAPSLWHVENWIMEEAKRSAGVSSGLARMLAARLRHELTIQKIDRS